MPLTKYNSRTLKCILKTLCSFLGWDAHYTHKKNPVSGPFHPKRVTLFRITKNVVASRCILEAGK